MFLAPTECAAYKDSKCHTKDLPTGTTAWKYFQCTPVNKGAQKMYSAKSTATACFFSDPRCFSLKWLEVARRGLVWLLDIRARKISYKMSPLGSS